jgi:hypothetical protein
VIDHHVAIAHRALKVAVADPELAIPAARKAKLDQLENGGL